MGIEELQDTLAEITVRMAALAKETDSRRLAAALVKLTEVVALLHDEQEATVYRRATSKSAEEPDGRAR